jgi:hypothetical protein
MIQVWGMVGEEVLVLISNPAVRDEENKNKRLMQWKHKKNRADLHKFE